MLKPNKRKIKKQLKATIEETNPPLTKATKEPPNPISNFVMHNGIPKAKDKTLDVYGPPGDNLYFNINFNSNPSFAVNNISYLAVREQSIVQKASDYYFSVLRFTIPGYYAPLASFICDEGSSLVGIYSLTISYQGYDATIPLTLLPTDLNTLNNYFGSAIFTPFGNRIYYIYDYTLFVQLINRTFVSIFAVLILQFPDDKTVSNQSNVPFVSFNPTTQLFSIWFSDEFQDGIGNFNLFCNEYFFELFNSFPNIRQDEGRELSPDGKDYKIKIFFTNNRRYPDAYFEDTLQQYKIEIQQNYPTIQDWNPFAKILLTTSLLPVRSEPVKGSGVGFSYIITDFEPPKNVITARSSFQYDASIYRLVDLISDSSINEVDIRILWEDLYQNQIPLYLQPNSNVSIKVAFFNKELFHSNALQGYNKI